MPGTLFELFTDLIDSTGIASEVGDLRWRVLLDTDAPEFCGSGLARPDAVEADASPYHGRPWSLVLDLPPLGALFLAPEGAAEAGR